MIGELNKWLTGISKAAAIYKAAASHQLIKPHDIDGNLHLFANDDPTFPRTAPGITSDVWQSIVQRIYSDPIFASELWLYSGLFDEGTKIFMPSFSEAQALSKIDLNIKWQDYRQPFETFIVVLPTGLFPKAISHDLGVPFGCIGRLSVEDRAFCNAVLTVGGDSATSPISWESTSDETIESMWKRRTSNSDLPYEELDDAEACIADTIQRIFINACLMLTHSGCFHKGKADPAFVATAQAKLKKKNLPAFVRAANEAAIALAPDVYGFDQHIRLYDEEGERSEGTGTGLPHKPHWRRGHWANQAHGVGHQLRKLIFRRPVLVNSHRFAGDLADTRVSMTMAKLPKDIQPG